MLNQPKWNRKMDNFSKITVVLHGPVRSSAQRQMELGITEKAIATIREFLPGSHIILSTWRDQIVDKLDVDEIILSEDPGCNIIAFDANGYPFTENSNRQIVGIREGLKRVKTEYAVKLRTDNYLTGNGFIAQQQDFPVREPNFSFLKERVVVAHRYTKMMTDGYKISRHICDFFAYGRTQDLINMWDIELFEDYKLNPNLLGRPQYLGAPQRITSTEQKFTTRWISKFRPEISPMKTHFDMTDHDIWMKILLNNLIVQDAKNLGLGSIKRLDTLKYRVNEMSHIEWQWHYKKYCDKNYPASLIAVITKTFFFRWAKAPISRLKKRFSRKQHPLGQT